MSGLIADAKTLIDKARVETQVRLDISRNSSVSAGGRLWSGMMVIAEELVGVGALCAAWLPAQSSCRTDSAASCAFFLFYVEHFGGNLMPHLPPVPSVGTTSVSTECSAFVFLLGTPRLRCPQLFWGTLPLLLSSLCIEGCLQCFHPVAEHLAPCMHCLSGRAGAKLSVGCRCRAACE